MCSASASAADATGPAGWMIVLRWVSSKSKVCDAMPLTSAALAMSTRSLRPSTVACGDGASSCTAASAASTVGWRAAPIAQPSQFMNVRWASRSTAAGIAGMDAGDELGEDARDRRRVGVGDDFRVVCHCAINPSTRCCVPWRPWSTCDVVAHVLAELRRRHRHDLQRFARKALVESRIARASC